MRKDKTKIFDCLLFSLLQKKIELKNCPETPQNVKKEMCLTVLQEYGMQKNNYAMAI
jgi:hypothetical protein